MRISAQKKHEAIINIFTKWGTPFWNEVYLDIAKDALEDEDITINEIDDGRMDASESVQQDLDEDDYGGWIEEYFSVMINMRAEDDGTFSVYNDVDTSHVFEDFDDRIGEFLKEKLAEFKKEPYSGLSFSYNNASLEVAIEKFKKLNNAFNNLAISKTNIWYVGEEDDEED
jgi:hypothetical protein